MEMKIPEHWNDCGMNWNDPDPTDLCYWYAIRNAALERRYALCVSRPNTGWQEDAYYRLFPMAENSCITAEMIRGLSMLISSLLDNSSYIVSKKQFLNDTTPYRQPPPSFADFYNPELATYPVPGKGSFIADAKKFLIWAKNVLDCMTMFLQPYVMLNHYYNGLVAYMRIEAKDELEGVEDPAERIRIAISAFIRKYADALTVKSSLCNTFDIKLSAKIVQSNSENIELVTQFPTSVVIRSFARPHVYGIIKHDPQIPPDSQWTRYRFHDFGYGFEEGKNKIIDLGQLSGEKETQISLFSFDLRRMEQILPFEDRTEYRFYGSFYFALDYNCKGGFQFRPDDINRKE